MNEDRIKRITEVTDKGSDEICIYKRAILEDLLKDSDILEALHNTELDLCSPEDFYNVNIFTYLKIPGTRSTVQNFICFEVDDIEVPYYNDYMITRQVTFRTVSHESDIETPWGVNRQDLLASLVKDRFAWSNILGTHLMKTYDTGLVSEDNYYYRILRFKSTTTNGLEHAIKSNSLDKERGLYDRRIR